MVLPYVNDYGDQFAFFWSWCPEGALTATFRLAMLDLVAAEFQLVALAALPRLSFPRSAPPSTIAGASTAVATATSGADRTAPTSGSQDTSAVAPVTPPSHRPPEWALTYGIAIRQLSSDEEAPTTAIAASAADICQFGWVGVSARALRNARALLASQLSNATRSVIQIPLSAAVECAGWRFLAQTLVPLAPTAAPAAVKLSGAMSTILASSTTSEPAVMSSGTRPSSGAPVPLACVVPRGRATAQHARDAAAAGTLASEAVRLLAYVLDKLGISRTVEAVEGSTVSGDEATHRTGLPLKPDLAMRC